MLAQLIYSKQPCPTLFPGLSCLLEKWSVTKKSTQIKSTGEEYVFPEFLPFLSVDLVKKKPWEWEFFIPYSNSKVEQTQLKNVIP